MTSRADIIAERQRALGTPEARRRRGLSGRSGALSHRELASLTFEVPGGPVYHGTIGVWARGLYSTADPDRLKVCAYAWSDDDYPPERLLRDLLEAGGQRIGEPETIDISELSERERRLVREQVATLLAVRAEGVRDGRSQAEQPGTGKADEAGDGKAGLDSEPESGDEASAPVPLAPAAGRGGSRGGKGSRKVSPRSR